MTFVAPISDIELAAKEHDETGRRAESASEVESGMHRRTEQPETIIASVGHLPLADGSVLLERCPAAATVFSRQAGE
jgi:hypothetical protein